MKQRLLRHAGALAGAAAAGGAALTAAQDAAPKCVLPCLLPPSPGLNADMMHRPNFSQPHIPCPVESTSCSGLRAMESMTAGCTISGMWLVGLVSLCDITDAVPKSLPSAPAVVVKPSQDNLLQVQHPPPPPPSPRADTGTLPTIAQVPLPGKLAMNALSPSRFDNVSHLHRHLLFIASQHQSALFFPEPARFDLLRFTEDQLSVSSATDAEISMQVLFHTEELRQTICIASVAQLLPVPRRRGRCWQWN